MVNVGTALPVPSHDVDMSGHCVAAGSGLFAVIVAEITTVFVVVVVM